MNTEQNWMHMLEWLHPVILNTLVCPFLYVFYKERMDALMLPLFICGFTLVFCSAGTRTAARRAVSLWTYLIVCIGSALSTLICGFLLCRNLAGRELALALTVELAVVSSWMIIDAGRIRMREKRRQKAERENDISWHEDRVLLEKPLPAALAWCCAVYLAALLNNCPQLCDLSLAGTAVYLMIVVAYRQAETTECYLSETAGITHVPEKKLRLLRGRNVRTLLFFLCLAMLPAILSRGLRSYRDLRFQDFNVVIKNPSPGCLLVRNRVPWTDLSVLFPDLGRGRPTPPWMNQVANIFFVMLVITVVCLVIRWIIRYGQAFYGFIEEENGDQSRSLEKENITTLHASEERSGGFFSEREKIRRRYRRVIHRYRKDHPAPGETPAEIEAKTDFPDRFDRKGLHEAYERARYRE